MQNLAIPYRGIGKNIEFQLNTDILPSPSTTYGIWVCVCTRCGVMRVYMYVLGVSYGCSLCMYYELGVMYGYSLYIYIYIYVLRMVYGCVYVLGVVYGCMGVNVLGVVYGCGLCKN